MKVITLSSGHEVKVDDEDYQKLSAFKWSRTISGGGNIYARRTVKGGTVPMHREILGLKTGEKVFVDHINGDGLDNRKENLRLCSRAENNKNRRNRKTGNDKYMGIYREKSGIKIWRATIKHNNKSIYLGHHATEEEAAHVYNVAALKYHGEFAALNNIALLGKGGEKCT